MLFCVNEMSYKRNVSVESIPLLIETVYCSEVDAILRNRKLLVCVI